jgi:hypothetical protein
MSDAPLIWTSKGNMPTADLEYSHAWEDREEYIKFTETYRHDGEIVKQSSHVYQKRGVNLSGKQAVI